MVLFIAAGVVRLGDAVLGEEVDRILMVEVVKRAGYSCKSRKAKEKKGMMMGIGAYVIRQRLPGTPQMLPVIYGDIFRTSK